MSDEYPSDLQGVETEGLDSTPGEETKQSANPVGRSAEAAKAHPDETSSPDDKEENTDSQAGLHSMFRRDKTHFPVYCLVEPTEEYWDVFAQYAEETPWFQICYENPPSRENVLAGIEANLDSDGPWQFIGRSIDEIYDFHKRHVRAPEKSTTIDPFTHFTFLVIDDRCVKPDDPEDYYTVIVCSDAPDYDNFNGESMLNSKRLPIEYAITFLTPLEQLTATLSEALHPDGSFLSSIPAFTHKLVTERPDAPFIAASFAESRERKREAIANHEKALKPTPAGRMLDDDRGTLLFRVGMNEAKSTAELHRAVEELSRGKGSLFRTHANHSALQEGNRRAKEEEGPAADASAHGLNKRRGRRIRDRIKRMLS